MTLRKPPASTPTSDESAIAAKALAFVQGAPDAKNAARAKGKRQQINIKFDDVFLGRVDADARKRGMNRTAWIMFACSELLGRTER